MSKYTLTRNAQNFRKQTFQQYDWNNYEDMQKFAQLPFVGRMAEVRMKELAYEENKRYWRDWSRNTGVPLDYIRYPIRTGVYGYYAGLGDYFEASQSVISLYASKLRRW